MNLSSPLDLALGSLQLSYTIFLDIVGPVTNGFVLDIAVTMYAEVK